MPADGLENQTKDWNCHPYLHLQDPSPFTTKCTTVILNVTTAQWKFRGARFLDHSMMEPQKARKQGSKERAPQTHGQQAWRMKRAVTLVKVVSLA
jgi:hypothetical protein